MMLAIVLIVPGWWKIVVAMLLIMSFGFIDYKLLEKDDSNGI